jgi:hypothetical protein
MTQISSRRAVVLAIVAVVVLAGVIGVWLATKKEGATAGTASSSSPGTPSVVADSETPTPTVRGDSTTTVTPSLPGDSPPPASGEVREYMVGDRRVRDHRKGDKPPIDIPPAIHPPDGRKIQSNLTSEIGQKLKVVVRECAATMPQEARGTSPRLEGLVVIAIKAKLVTITKATVQLRDVVGASVDPIKQCIEQKSLAVTHATDEPDLDSYDINVSYSL